MNRAACLIIVSLVIAFTPARSSSQELVLHKQGTKEYHRPGCDAISDGKNVLAMSRAQAEGRGLKPHSGCDPVRIPPPASGAAGSQPTRVTDAPVFVFVDAAAKPSRGRNEFYHRETCAQLPKARRRLPIDEAGKQFWPCPKCRPPIRKRR